MLKSQGRAESVKYLVSFDEFGNDVKGDAEDVGLALFHISEVIEAGK